MIWQEFKKEFHNNLHGLIESRELDNIFFLLMEAYCQVSKLDLFVNKGFELKDSQLTKLNSVIGRLKLGEPIQYILGYAEFADLYIKVTQDVLIPRPETEELVRWIVKNESQREPLHILDVCCGSGCIALALKKQINHADISAFDISKKALAIAAENAKINELAIGLYQLDVLKEGLSNSNPNSLSVIVSNPPYITEKELVKLNLEWEPRLALAVDDTAPIKFYERIADLGNVYLERGGSLYFELNEHYAENVFEMLQSKSYSSIEIALDMQGKKRMIRAEKSFK